MSTDGLRVLVVDDEAPARDELGFLLEREPGVAGVVKAGDATEALRELHHGDVQAVFLDISMPGLDGLELARILGRFASPPPVVFVTAHEQHAVEAFELHAVDYLLKPVRAERLSDALQRVRAAVGAAAAPVAAPVAVTASAAADAAADAAALDDLSVVECDIAGRTRFVRREDVRYVEAAGDYARLHTATDSYLVRLSLATIESRWTAAGFCRVHRRYLVNVASVVELRSDHAGTEVLVGDRLLPVSRRLVRDVRDRLRRAAREAQP